MSYLENQFGLKNRLAVITGGGGTLCSAIAEGFLKAEAKVSLWGHKMATLEEKKSELIANGANPEHIGLYEVNLLEEPQIIAALESTVTSMGPVDILVNGVGGSSVRTALIESDSAEFERIIKLNLMGGCFLPTKCFASYWIKKNIQGKVLNIASMASFNPLSGAWGYSAAKAAVMNQTMAQARELADFGIRVNAVAPGFFLGKQNHRLLQNEDGTPTTRGQNVLAHTPARRFGKPEELCAAAIFLCSPGAGFVNGVTLPVDGGYLCHNI
jgi:NAD(P)-dependent dehydrogenase (short-subunit alcohol dehydrogenase family)